MRRTFTSIGTAAALTLACAAAAWAADDAGLPAERHAGSTAYVTGGVSTQQAAAFRAARAGYPLSIELLQQTGGSAEYTANAQVKVTDAGGAVVLDAKAEGPFMLVRVPAGHYRVQATLQGRSVESKTLTVGDKGSAQAVLTFPANTD